MSASVIDWLFPGASLGFFICGLMLFFEILRPFRDLKYDGPIGMTCWILGILIAALGIWYKKSLPVPNGILLAVNALALTGLLILYFILSRVNKLY